MITIISTIFFLLVIPFCLGIPIARKLEGSEISLPLIYVCGLLVYLGIFQIIYISFILYYNHFTILVYVIIAVMGLLSVLAVMREKRQFKVVFSKKFTWNKKTKIPWIFVFAIIVFQLYYTIFYQFIDGDDAYYGALSLIIERWETMYLHVPYTGYTSSFDVRHGFSGAPVFVAFIARVIQMHPIVVYHIIIPVLIIVMMYVIYGMIGAILFKTNPENVPIFLTVIGLLYLYGNTSIYTAATFALTRTAQGKAIICNLVVPIVFYLILRIGENCRENKSNIVEFFLLSMATLMGGFSTMLGLVLVPILSGIAMLVLAIGYKKWKLIGMQIIILIPVGILGVLYMITVY